jgi:hypothetical protein
MIKKKEVDLIDIAVPHKTCMHKKLTNTQN